MHGEKHIDRYPHRTSPMDKYKHEFKKSKSRLLLENTIPLSPCSFLVALFNIERSSILLRSDRTLSRLDNKRLHVLRTNVWQKLGGGCETVWHSARTQPFIFPLGIDLVTVFDTIFTSRQTREKS